LSAPGYLQKHGKPRSPAELADHACPGFTSHASWPDWPLRKGGSRHTVRPTGPLVADNTEVLLPAAIEGAGIIFMPDWLAVPAMREGRLVEVLPDWSGAADGGCLCRYAARPARAKQNAHLCRDRPVA
jgi:DNA-binding transcriptional LysR family regulator